MHHQHKFKKSLFVILLILTPSILLAMGLRSFVALPIEKGGTVLRMQYLTNLDTKIDTFIGNIAYGIDHKQTLLIGLPYRLSPKGRDRLGDDSVLYRNIVWQQDQASGTQRLGLLGGMVFATDSKRDNAWQAGAVYTKYQGRNEWDIDFLYQKGMGNRADTGRYDFSWQHRLTPATYPDWGTPNSEWDSVLELNGRWKQSLGLTHQVTLGIQRITASWVLEAGVVKNLNKTKDTQLLLSTRFHF